MIQIKRNNKVFYTIEDICEGSKLSRQLMDHHYVILKFSTEKPVYFEIGDSVEIPDFGYFELTSAYFPKYNDSTNGYDYELQMDAYYMAWKNKICKYRPQYGANETSFKFTTSVAVHLNVILGNLKALGYKYNGLDFAVDYTTYNKGAFDVDKRFYIEYGSISILDAINAICDENALDCEWWVDGNIIYLGYCEMTGQVTFEQGVNMLSMSYSESKSSYITRLYAFGSDKNIPTGYFTGSDADVTTDGVATDYLMLPNKDVDSDGFYSKNGYLENTNVVKNEKQAIEGVVMFDDEYPKVECAVSGIKTYDSTVEENGEKTTRTFWQVTSKDSFATNFSKSWIKRNLTLMIKFTSGALMGMEFDVEYKIIDQVNYFEIVANDTYGRSLPDGVMCPKEGDKFFLYNWDATKITETNLIQKAQDALYERAKAYYLKSMVDNSNFTCVLDAVKFYNRGVYNYHPLGEQVKLINPMFSDVDANGKHYRNSRIIGMDINLDIPYDAPTYIVGEQAASSRLSKLEDKVTSITVNGIQIGGTGSGGGGVYVIGLNDSTPATDSNVYSARRVDQNYTNKYREENIREIYTFAKGLVSEILAQLKGGATFGNNGYQFDKDGNVVVDTLHSLAFDEALEQGFGFTKNARGKYTLSVTDLLVWGKAVFNSLEIRKLYSVGGNVYLSGASSKLQHVVPVTDADGEVTGWKCYILGDDGTTATQNGWARYDQAKCQTFDIKEGVYENVSNTYYWRLVTDVSTENEAITETYTDADGKEQTRDLYDGKKFGWVVLSKTDCESAANDAPKAGDTIVLDGHRMFASGDPEGRDQYNDESRTNVMMLETTGVSGGSLPRIVALTGITDYRHSEGKNEYSNTVFILSPKEVVFVSSSIKWISASGDPITFVNFRGNWAEGTKYAYYDQVSHNNAIWTCVVEKGTTTTEEPSDTSKDWRKEISGGKGDKGDPGTPGNGIDHVETRFFAWKSDTFGPGFDSDRVWEDGSTTMPADFSDDFPWLWQVTRTYYTNGTDVLGEAVCIGYKGKDGSNGKDAVTYGVQVGSYYEWTSGGKLPGLEFGFTKTTGATVGKVTDVRNIGCTVMIYGDGTYYSGASGWINEGNGNFLFSTFPYGDKDGNPTLGDASVVCVELYLDGIVVATANYSNGKQGADGIGALEISVAPDTLVFDTNDNGIVPSGTSKTATIACYRDGNKVTNVEYALTEGGHPDCDASISTSNSTATVTISDIATEEPYGVSKTCGTVEVRVYDKDNDRYYFPTVKFSVNVAKFNGGLKADNKRFETTYNYLTNNGKDPNFIEFESKIRQTAKEISLHVSEKRAGRRNLLPGSAFRKQGEGCSIVQDGQDAINGICINGGYDGVNCARLRNEGDRDAAYPRISWDGGRNSNVKVAKGKKYTLSFWAKRLSATEGGYEISTQFFLQDGANGYSRPYGALKMGSFTVKSQGKWEFIQDTVTIPSDAKANYMEVCICLGLSKSGMAEILVCRPMLEEGEEYNGWTLSEQDYDYVGGNLLDNAGTLVRGGNLGTLRGTVTQNAFDGNSAVVNMVTHKLAGRVSTKTSLPTSASYGDYYACNDTWRIWKYTGTTLVDNEHYNGFTLVDSDEEMLHNDFLAFSLELGDYEDYVVSWYAKGDAEVGVFVEGSGQEVTVECSDGFSGDGMTYGERSMRLTSEWKRYWAHFRKTKGTVRTLCFRQYRNDDNTASRFYLSQPKLEVGATMTEWTAKRSDMVDKQALYATGIDIDSKKIVATADNFVVRNNSGTPTFSIDEEGNIVGSGGASFNGPMKATTFTLNSTYFSVKEDGTITAKGGQISFFYFDAEGMASAVEYDSSQNKPWRGIGLSSNNISVSGYTGQRISSVFLGKGLIDSRFAGSDKNYIVHRVGTTSSASTFYNYIKLERFEDGHDSYENDPEYAALGIETQGDFCLAALGGPSLFAGMCFASNTGGSFSADKRHCFYLCSGGTFYMPSDPPDGMLIVVIQTGGRIDFNGNKHRFRCGTNYSESCNSNSAGQWNLFYYDGSNWNTVYTNGRPW